MQRSELIQEFRELLAESGEASSLLASTLQYAADLVGVLQATMLLLTPDASELELVASLGQPAAEGQRVALQSSISGWVVENQRSVSIEKIAMHPVFAKRHDPELEQSPLMAVQLRIDDHCVGVACFWQQKEQEQVPDALDLQSVEQFLTQSLSQFTGSNSRKDRGVRISQLYQELTNLHAFSRSLLIESDQEQVLERGLRQIRQSLGSRVAFIGLTGPGGLPFTRFLSRGNLGKRPMEPHSDGGVCGWVVTQQKPVLLTRSVADPRFDADRISWFEKEHFICYPLATTGRPYGVIGAIDRRSAMTPHQLDVLETLALVIGANYERTLADELQLSLNQQLEQATQYTEDLVNAMPDALIVLSFDGSIERANPAALRLLGYSEESILGRPFEELVVQQEGLPERELAELLGENDGWRQSLLLRTRGGDLRTVSFHSSPMDERLVLVGRDISEVPVASQAPGNLKEPS